MIFDQEKFNLKSTTTDDWGNVQRIVLDLEALTQTQDWKIEVPLDNYEIDQIYNAELIKENGKTYISGADWNNYLEQGEKTEIILIVNEVANSSYASSSSQSSDFDSGTESVTESFNQSGSALNIDSQIVEDWYGGYKLEIDLKTESDIQNWQADFSFPYKIRAAYGVDLSDRGDGNYTISGENGWGNLQQGQSVKSILIIDDYGQTAITPEFKSSDKAIESEMPNPPAEPVIEPEPVPEPVPENNDVVESEVNSPPSEPVIEQNNNDGLVANPNGAGKIINVDNDFGGNLESAIASATDGDVIQLGGNTYYTDGITLDKDITIDGQEGTVIDGKGTSESIFTLNSNASGATIQDLQITNGSIGIYAYSTFNLTLQNLELNNIGLNQTVRDGQYNTGIVLNRADGLQLLNSYIHDIGRKGVGINDTDGAVVSGLTVQNINLAAQHAQSFDAAGVKLFNTNDVIVQDSYFSDINAFNIWNDTTNATTIAGNVMENVGEDFLKPQFNTNVDIAGIYNEKSPNSIIKNNRNTAVGDFPGLDATEFSTQTMTLENNNFSSLEVNTPDFWVNESVEKLIAITEDPTEADFSLFEDEFFAQANIG
ncbi:MAG: right-handed parallel beta-helix repeat-containing protein [Cyanobacteria bacterium P01_G01_bin.67]